MSRRLLLATGGSSPVIPDPEPAPTVYVFSLVGQSNMEGAGSYDAELDTSDPRILVWPGSGPNVGTIIEAVEPIPGITAPNPNIGPGMPFARAMLPSLSDAAEILLVPSAVGATTIANQWNPSGGVLYAQSIARANAALAAAGEGAVLAGFLWLQGESDSAGNMSGGTYEVLLDALIAGMRAGVTDADDAPFLVLGMVPEFTQGTAAEIRAVHADTPNRVARTAYVPGPAGMNNGDDLHYNGAAQRILGADAFDAYAELTA